MRARLDWVLVTLLAISALGNVYLIGQRSATTIAPQGSPEAPAVGQVLPILEGKRLDGSHVRIDHAGSKSTLLYVFSPSCVWCERNASAIKAIVSAAGDRFEVVAVSPVPVSKDQAVEKGLAPASVITGISPSILQQAHFGATPTTLLVEPGGRISHVWAGAFSREAMSDIAAVIGVDVTNRPASSNSK